MIEVWKPCVGFTWNYEVSNLGRVRSLGNAGNNRHGVILKSKVDRGGYLTIPSMRNNEGVIKTTKIHRMVAQAFIPNPEFKVQVNHIDGDKQNNRVDNLEWCTHKENFNHAVMVGLRPIGEEHGRHKLTWVDVDKIRHDHIKGDKLRGANALAKKYGVTPRTIKLIVEYEIWNKRREGFVS
jgi:hypothetical protein